MPPFPTDDFNIVYRHQAGLTYRNGTSPQLLTPSEDPVVLRKRISSTTFECKHGKLKTSSLRALPTRKAQPDSKASPPSSTSSAEIVAGFRIDPRYTALGARTMLGRSSTAVITFAGPHVPYYITSQSGDYRCKPQDICPTPREAFCYKCGQEAVSQAHDCLCKCEICEQALETAGKECKKKLRPSPPPYQVRQQQLIKAKARQCPWNPSCDEFSELNNPLTASGSPPQGQPGPSSSILRARSRSRTRSRSRSRSCSVQQISYADAAQGDSKSCHKHTSVSPIETGELKVLENRILDQQKCYEDIATKSKTKVPSSISSQSPAKNRKKPLRSTMKTLRKCSGYVKNSFYQKKSPLTSPSKKSKLLWKQRFSVIETKHAALVGSQLTTLAESKSTARDESRLEAIVETKLEPITNQFGNTFTTLSRTMGTHTAQINELKSQLTDFITHVDNNRISHADLENLSGRKKPRTQARRLRARTTHQRERIRLLMHNYAGSEADLLHKLCEELRGKCKLLVLKARTRGRPPACKDPEPCVTFNGVQITEVASLRVLGLHQDGSGAATLPRLQRTISQLTHLIRRVANRRSGLKEQDTLSVV
ncbi:hypothetical protein HPB50_008068 [Hyalomma asiaticum]|uniref:Uncharacterized protein n=1 Tax=Hyalomma asiaticum TaxID=266040 RepID=A0ACB7SKJ8_HYAAI|nr:hypothetical protein HPB50_008068 [Hyalomma asiaticum]